MDDDQLNKKFNFLAKDLDIEKFNQYFDDP